MTDILHNKRIIWLTFIGVALATLIIYVLTSLNAGQGNLLMPLDDVYIHFQYAKQMALGHPYQYNLIDPPTSGATSFIYPYLLALGYVIGFKGLWLGLWAMILGTIALVLAIWAVYRLCKALDVPQWLSLLTAITFGLSGSIGWHFMSGMETGIIITLTLLTLLFVVEKQLTSFLIVSTLLSLTRPEGGLIAAIAAGTMFLRLWHDYSAQEKHPPKRKYLLFLVIPILAIGVQPLVNVLMTGTTVATGTQAKSILATVPQDYALIFSRIWDNFSRMWIEFVTGYDAREGRAWYLPIFTGLLGLIAIPMLMFKKDYRVVGLMLLGWFLALSVAISTLDNAFWHFKRYQMPMLALFFPLATWVIAEIWRRFSKTRYQIYVFSGIVTPIFAITLFAQFQHYHAMNVSYVYQQPYQMAIWLRDNTPEDALIAVHDVGLMRYLGERSTLDMVGLTTPGAAAYWRNGPGSVAEFLINHQPDYIASYGRGHGYGLAYLAETSLYENQLAEFTIDDWQPYLNVALATDSQGIYQPDWDLMNPQSVKRQCSYSAYGIPNFVDDDIIYLNVGDIQSEEQFEYRWDSNTLSGFATEVRNFGGYRLINQYESFELSVPKTTNATWMLVSRVHAASAGTIDIFVDENLIDTQWIPDNPGRIMTISTVIYPQYTQDEYIQIRVEPHMGNGFYMPICHVLRPFITLEKYQDAIATFEDGIVQLIDFGIRPISDLDDSTVIDLFWAVENGSPMGDYRLFIHVYDDVEEPPVLQWDGYFVGMPLGNWQAGLLVPPPQENIFLNLAELSPGTYQLAIGFYNPNDTTDRLIPESDVYEVTPDGRLWLGEVEIK